MTLESTLKFLYPEKNLAHEFPKNMDQFHKALRLGFESNVQTINGNRIILSTATDTYFSMLKRLVSIGSESSMISNYGNIYLTSFLKYATFSPVIPPVGLVPPVVGIVKVYVPSQFNYNGEVLTKEEQITMLSLQIKSWISSNQTMETGSMITPAGVVPAPPVFVPLICLS